MQNKWVSIWGNAMSISENRPESYGKNITFSYPIESPFSGDCFKITFDNYCGLESVTFTNACVLYKNQSYPLLVNGKSSFDIRKGQAIQTDELHLKINQGDEIEIRFYFKDFVQLRSSVYVSGPCSKGLYAVGNYTDEADIPMELTKSTNIFYFLNDVSIHTAEENRAIICYGDSITAQDWPDYLKLRCKEEGYLQTSVIRKATSGSRILREYHCITYESYGLSGRNRFPHEAPVDGADTIIIQQGINDIIHPVGIEINPYRPMSDLPTVEELKKGMRYYINEAHKLGYQVYLGTLLPIEGWRTYAPFREELKNSFNDWILTTNEVEGSIDFAKAVADKSNVKAFAQGMDSGDHLHPSREGYQAMANAVPSFILK